MRYLILAKLHDFHFSNRNCHSLQYLFYDLSGIEFSLSSLVYKSGVVVVTNGWLCN